VTTTSITITTIVIIIIIIIIIIVIVIVNIISLLIPAQNFSANGAIKYKRLKPWTTLLSPPGWFSLATES